MEAKIALLALAVAVSGCAHTGSLDTGTESGEAKQLKVTEFGVVDQQLTPGQSSVIRLKLKNYHTQPITIEDISLYNTGFLEVSGKSCSPEQIQQARKGFAPEMVCTWEVKAPENLEGFGSKAVTMQLNLRYDSALSNQADPLKVRFAPLEDIEKREQVERTFSNGEIAAEISYENPVPQQGGVISFRFEPKGPGRVASGYSISYRPSSLFSDCPRTAEAITQDQASFSCDISSGSEATRNLVFSTSYKYVKSPSLDIEVVKP